MSMFSSANRKRSIVALEGSLTAPDQLTMLQARDEALAEYIEALTEGNFLAPGCKGEDRLSKAVANLAARLAEDASNKLDAIVDINVQSNETAISAARMLTACRDVDQRTQALAAASEEMVASVGQIRSNAEDAAANAAQMRAGAEQGMSTVRLASKAMERVEATANDASDKVLALSAASEEIGAIVGSIDAIARQTNLLALNATIEAARPRSRPRKTGREALRRRRPCRSPQGDLARRRGVGGRAPAP